MNVSIRHLKDQCFSFQEFSAVIAQTLIKDDVIVKYY